MAAPRRHVSADASAGSSYASTSELESTKLFKDVPPLCIFRPSPRPCINQDLVDELKIIRKARFMLFAQTEKGISYATAVSAIIGCPYLITSKEQAAALPHVGSKIAGKVEEFLRTGEEIQEARNYTKDARLKAVTSFQLVHGIGYKSAGELYDQGYRTLDDLRATGRYSVAFKYFDDIQVKSEVENACAFIKLQLDRIEPGAHVILCGGYRRGKELSNDIDILITYPHEEGKERGILRKLLKKLLSKGLIPSDGILGQQHIATDRTVPDNLTATMMDGLDKALVIFRHPPSVPSCSVPPRTRDYWRRVDIVVTAWSSYGSAVIGWTGSTQFERDLRRHAETLNMRFDSGALRNIVTSVVVPTVLEEDVFLQLGIPWIPPELRNCDP